ncbi:MAG: PorT family protein [Fibromonadales bacterium]|nr:PorT family protein [Fibromonadales bacterium]
MLNKLSKITLGVIFWVALCFAQEAPPKLAVYVSGASGGINKSLGSKLLSAMSQSGSYAEIADPVLLQEELSASGKGDLASIAQTARHHGADYVCVVTMTEAFGAHSITARLARVSDLQVLKSGTTDRALKSFDDLTAVSGELARQLLPQGGYVPLAPPAAFAAAPASTGQCEETHNINEVIFKIKDRFPAKLKDCASTLAKDMLNPFGKKLEPKSFLTQCTVDGIKKELPAGFPGTDKIVASLTKFVQGIVNAALSGGSLDPKKLLSVVASLNVMELVSDVKKLSDEDCVVDEPYEPPEEEEGEDYDEEGEGSKKKKSSVSFGIRAGVNLSHIYAEYEGFEGKGDYGDIFGMQAGFVVDFPISDWFHIQPGLMYIQRGMDDRYYLYETIHYIELPLLLSFKLDVLRLNAGPYLGVKLFNYQYFDRFDIGLSSGIGFDIGMFYIGAFYDYGLVDVTSAPYYKFYNRTIGFNLGINL